MSKQSSIMHQKGMVIFTGTITKKKTKKSQKLKVSSLLKPLNSWCH